MYRSLFLLSGSLVLMYMSLFPTCRFLSPTCRSLLPCTFRKSRRILTERAGHLPVYLVGLFVLREGLFFPICKLFFFDAPFALRAEFCRKGHLPVYLVGILVLRVGLFFVRVILFLCTFRTSRRVLTERASPSSTISKNTFAAPPE